MARAELTHAEVWQRFVAMSKSLRDSWRRAVGLATGLPEGRIHVLRKLRTGPHTLAELAFETGNDAPATTVAVNDLEERGMVLRKPHPTNKRAKLVSLTPAGRTLMAKATREIDRVPPGFTNLSQQDLQALGRILDALGDLPQPILNVKQTR